MKFLTVDIECVGDKLRCHIPAVGFALGDPETGTVIETRLFKILPGEGDLPFTKECKENFWDKNPGLFENLQTDAMECKAGWKAVNDYIESVYKTYDKEKVEIRSDNPEFDLGCLNFALYFHAGREYSARRTIPSHPDERATYHCIEDIGSQLSVLHPQFKKFIKSQSPPHTHTPDEDALHMLYNAFHVYKYFKV